YDSRPGHEEFSPALCKMYGIKYEHMPRLIECHEVAGNLRKKQADELGLKEGIKVYGSGGDATLIGVGAGAVSLGDTHIYCGTSGWVSTVINKQEVDIVSMIAGIVGATKGRYNYFAEMETAGKCFEWVKDHLALDEIDIYLSKADVENSPESEYMSLYDYLSDVIDKVNPCSDGVIFTPWLHGNRCPFEDPNAQGIFFNIGINTGKRQMLRAVIEGICFHLRWMLECSEKKVTTSKEIRFVGGGALSPVTCQILADILGRKIITIENTKDVGAIGAAMLVAVGAGLADDLSELREFVVQKKVYEPNYENKKLYDKQFVVFKQLYKSNAKNFKLLNS
ncbi:MAG: carbohydrate kinase, partial [Lachnospiraceae bacterium]|nr:carbohydrate kinase [Lachnospiraceae bacterium]